jgi:hypothetical protein
MRRRAEKFDSFDTSVGKYSSRKVPKWTCNNNDLVDYLAALEEEPMLGADRHSSWSFS